MTALLTREQTAPLVNLICEVVLGEVKAAAAAEGATRAELRSLERLLDTICRQAIDRLSRMPG